jgi:hypothetical protein
LVGACQHVGCGESAKDHSSNHAEVCYLLFMVSSP